MNKRVKLLLINDRGNVYDEVYIDKSFKGYFFFDMFAHVYVYVFGKSLRGRHYYTLDKETSLKRLNKDLEHIYNI